MYYLGCLIWIFLGLNFKKLLLCLKPVLSNLSKSKVFCKKKFFKLPQLAALGLQFKKLWILESRSFIRNKKSLNFGLKMTFLVSFRSQLQVKLLPYLKSAPSNFPVCKVMLNKKPLKFGTKIALFRYFWAGIWKTHCHVWNQLLRIYQKYIFNQYSELWHRSHFF